jgi:hypothetical protein
MHKKYHRLFPVKAIESFVETGFIGYANISFYSFVYYLVYKKQHFRYHRLGTLYVINFNLNTYRPNFKIGFSLLSLF